MTTDREDRGWTKSQESAAVSPAAIPAARPPSAPATTATTARMRATLVLAMWPRAATSTAATRIGAIPPRARLTPLPFEREFHRMASLYGRHAGQETGYTRC